ncbi:MAG: CbrC family protein [Hyphomonadaceae bacterium]
MTDPRKPDFRFYPGAYAEGAAFEASTAPCAVCGQACGWRYRGNIYVVNPPQAVCAACIASGRLAAQFEHLSLHDIALDGAEPALETELLQRTPGVACFNPFVWPVLDGTPLAFLGYGDDPSFAKIEAAQAAAARAGEDVGLDDMDLPSAYALVFKELDGERYEASLDFD